MYIHRNGCEISAQQENVFLIIIFKELHIIRMTALKKIYNIYIFIYIYISLINKCAFLKLLYYYIYMCIYTFIGTCM